MMRAKFDLKIVSLFKRTAFIAKDSQKPHYISELRSFQMEQNSK